MEQNTGQEKQIPKPKKKMSNFVKAFLWKAIPIIVFTALACLERWHRTLRGLALVLLGVLLSGCRLW